MSRIGPAAMIFQRLSAAGVFFVATRRKARRNNCPQLATSALTSQSTAASRSKDNVAAVHCVEVGRVAKLTFAALLRHLRTEIFCTVAVARKQRRNVEPPISGSRCSENRKAEPFQTSITQVPIMTRNGLATVLLAVKSSPHHDDYEVNPTANALMRLAARYFLYPAKRGAARTFRAKAARTTDFKRVSVQLSLLSTAALRSHKTADLADQCSLSADVGKRVRMISTGRLRY